jgi:septin family protein
MDNQIYEIRAILPGEPLELYDLSVMLLGASGAGKSTLVNTLINVFYANAPGSLQAAVVCTKYPNTTPEFDDSIKERNNTSSGESQTEDAHFYKISSNFTYN